MFVTIRRSAMGGLKTVERFPLAEEGWAQAWDALVKVDPGAAEKARAVLKERERRDIEQARPAELASCSCYGPRARLSSSGLSCRGLSVRSGPARAAARHATASQRGLLLGLQLAGHDPAARPSRTPAGPPPGPARQARGQPPRMASRGHTRLAAAA